MSSKDVRNLREIYPFVSSILTTCIWRQADEKNQPWQLSHRIDLHEALKAKATSLHGPGVPVTIHLRSKVIDCDPARPSLTLADGSQVQGDLLIGADGVHVCHSLQQYPYSREEVLTNDHIQSVLRKIVAQEDIAAEPSGGSAFRFLIPISKVRANPETAALVQKDGELQFWDGQYRRLVIYPCRLVKLCLLI